LIAAAGLLMTLQLVPLPPIVWKVLPGRGAIAQGFALAGVPAPWLPLSLAPDETIAQVLSLLPPLAMALAIFASAEEGRRRSAAVLIAIAVGSVLLGLAQITGGPDSPFYFYGITNRESAVGFFANRNHLGTLLLAALPFLAAFAVTSDHDARRRIGRHMLIGGLVLLVLCGLVLDRSRAGLLLAVPISLGCVAFVLPHPRSRHAAVRAAAGVACGLVLFAALIAATRGLGGFVPDAGAQHRATIVPTTLRAAADYLPFGSGGGSFQQIYPSYEDAAAVTPEFINHAHCDYAEFLLEYGAPGAILILTALALWIGRGRALAGLGAYRGRLGRAGFVALGAAILHSGVDYPLRTAAIAVVAAMAAALVTAPEPLVAGEAGRSRTRARPSMRLSAAAADL
jgi:hypothetical protein